MAFGDVVQSIEGSDESYLTCPVSTFGATTGNLMILCCGNRSNQTYAPSGWTELGYRQWTASSSTRTYIFAKLAAASESDVVLDKPAGRPFYTLWEIDGSFESLPTNILEYSGDAENASVSPSTGLAPGTTGTLSQSSNFAFTALMYRGDNSTGDGPASFSTGDGFTEGTMVEDPDTALKYELPCLPAYLVTSSTSALNPTTTWTVDGTPSTYATVSMIVVLKAASTGSTYNESVSDGLDVGETPAAALIANGSVTDGFRGSDSDGSLANLDSGVTDGLDVAESIQALANLFSSVTEGLDLSDSPTVGLVFDDSITEGFALGEVISALSIMAALGLDGIDLSDSASSLGVFESTLSEGTTYSEITTGGLDLLTSVTDGLELSETTLSTLEIFSSIQDGMTFGETLDWFYEIIGTVSEGLVVGEISNALASIQSSVTDSFLLSEQLSALANFISSIQDGAVFTDSTEWAIDVIEGLVTESISLGSSTSSSVTFEANASDTFLSGEQVLSVVSYLASSQDGVRVADTPVGLITLAKVLSDSLIVGDISASSLLLLSSITDGATFSDSGELQLTLDMAVSDGLAVASTLSAIGQFAAILSESIIVTDISFHRKAEGLVSITLSIKLPTIAGGSSKPTVRATSRKPGILTNE